MIVLRNFSDKEDLEIKWGPIKRHKLGEDSFYQEGIDKNGYKHGYGTTVHVNTVKDARRWKGNLNGDMTRGKRIALNGVLPAVSAGIAEASGGKLKHHAVGLGASLVAGSVPSASDLYYLHRDLYRNSKPITGKGHSFEKFEKQVKDKIFLEQLGEHSKHLLNSALAYGGTVAAIKAGKYAKKKLDERRKKSREEKED